MTRPAPARQLPAPGLDDDEPPRHCRIRRGHVAAAAIGLQCLEPVPCSHLRLRGPTEGGVACLPRANMGDGHLLVSCTLTSRTTSARPSGGSLKGRVSRSDEETGIGPAATPAPWKYLEKHQSDSSGWTTQSMRAPAKPPVISPYEAPGRPGPRPPCRAVPPLPPPEPHVQADGTNHTTAQPPVTPQPARSARRERGACTAHVLPPPGNTPQPPSPPLSPNPHSQQRKPGDQKGAPSPSTRLLVRSLYFNIRSGTANTSVHERRRQRPPPDLNPFREVSFPRDGKWSPPRVPLSPLERPLAPLRCSSCEPGREQGSCWVEEVSPSW